MGKKRTKGKTAQADESLDIVEPVCKHIRKGLEQSHLKKALLNVEWHVCQDCKADNKTQENEEETDESPPIWLCLKCGHRGCGRNSQEQHALTHYTTPRSDSHCLVLSLDNWSVWCYICDNEVPYSTSTRLGQTVDYIKKQVCVSSSRLEKQQENKDVGIEKVEKDSRNEQEKEVLLKESSHSSTNSEVTVKGLSNLGNTCFFNAVMQNLSQTPVLRELLKEAKMPDTTVKIESPELSMEPQLVKLDQPGPLTLAMHQFLTEMQETKRGVVTPKELFAQVCKKAIRFKGYQQQDSQELLRYLLDGMRAEEIQRISVGILKALTDSDKQNEEELRRKIKEYEKKKGIKSFVDRIFGGELTSAIMCEECRTVSLVHESFLDLSLPVLDDQKTKNTNERNLKKNKGKESEEEEEGKNNDYYIKQRDEPPGTSKHLQKKAKKQAKKQAKCQRRQQKLQGKVLQLTEICATEESEKDVACDQEGEAEINSEIPDVKQEEESSNDCKDDYLTQNDLNIQENSTDVQSMHESTGKPEQECVEKESIGDPPTEDLDSPVEFVNGLDDLSLKDEDEENEDEEGLAADFSKLHLGASTESDINVIDDLQTVPAKTCEILTEDAEMAFRTLASREDLNPEEGSIHHCLYQFTHNEKLSENNRLLCDVCTRRRYGPKNAKNEKHVYTNAKKQMLISLAPPILTLHLKRFQQAGFNLRKVNRHIKFPEVIDLAPFCTVKCKNVAEGNTKVLYSLYGVVEHSGTMRSGHYTAYAKMRNMNNHLCDLVLQGQPPQALETEPIKGQWFHISDTHVQAVSTSKVLSSQAYLLFYERLL
ncbi:ubiquitin carboxyl-terminal hydrolase 16 isoform X2 [Tympanuchus pallidicinctus]|uniref:ubiquitin carboxyl-terminal hydrolase 16 isoform X2 n=1 Tax=Tympanuchus pallidicinctus TaxID=109042 RepID=UPI002286E413|nr:ubiquitin carboxyl-terminal hydrolase 16 isoform X2 [Tympanuchus pallidicinctus]